MVNPVFQEQLEPLGYQQIVAATLASATALTVPSRSQVAIMKVEAGALRWRDDGSDPTSAVGMLEADGAKFFYCGDLSTFKAIRVDATTILNVSYYRGPN